MNWATGDSGLINTCQSWRDDGSANKKKVDIGLTSETLLILILFLSHLPDTGADVYARLDSTVPVHFVRDPGPGYEDTCLPRSLHWVRVRRANQAIFSSWVMTASARSLRAI